MNPAERTVVHGRFKPDMMVEIKAVASTLARMERQLFSYAMGDE